MKKSRIFLAAGSFLLAITAVFATKANKKFENVLTAKWGSSIVLHSNAGILTTTQISGRAQLKITIYTHGGANISRGLLVSNSDNSKVYYN